MMYKLLHCCITFSRLTSFRPALASKLCQICYTSWIKVRTGKLSALRNLAAIYRASRACRTEGKERPPLPVTCPLRELYQNETIKLTNACHAGYGLQ